MALLRIPSESRVIEDVGMIRGFLQEHGITYERWETPDGRAGRDASQEEILAAYGPEVSALMERGGYITADVVNVTPDVPGLQEMLDRFNKEHRHAEDEVRFIVKGSGIFYIHPEGDAPVFSIEVHEGDLINVPAGVKHWFDLCAERTIRAIRLFKEKAGWTPLYTGDEIASQYQPLCFGPAPFSDKGLGIGAAAFPDHELTEFSGKLILLDVEGTVAPLAFVHEVMFPFARARVGAWLRDHWGHDVIPMLARSSGVEAFENPEAATAAVLRLMDADAKETSLKQLQGFIWEAGFRDGELRSPLFKDVAPAFDRWREREIEVRIYSSGSVHAQRLFFANTSGGDLTPYLSCFYDTETGSKKEVTSYVAIAADCGLEPDEILFISDSVDELNAARSAGMRTALALRPGNPPQNPGGHPVIRTFDTITPHENQRPTPALH